MANDHVLSAAGWKKSRRSGNGNSNCVEIAVLSDSYIGIRDSKAGPGGPVLAVNRQCFQDFIHAARSGVFDRTPGEAQP
ncbi:DUF397 domain-containing protein [Phytohabitans sp. ZYX-F-186]|uniref:DUF397 domain-containing protein n=1 Tax=Phytohabitans maris TaxID=3071409 RepID=A0ABU0ZBR0_9ACTN|nr:DUF397 domain-containing protein [Phytohabitans sp. ZYX-F-186]MDQ7904503.1 DUF397 domain-containing protein [Phytohabitans sp. ZYX-F-186]